MMTNNTQQLESKNSAISRALDIIQVLGRAVMEAKEIPSGTLYAAVMGKISLAEYEGAMRILKNSGVVKETNNLLTWNA